MINDVHKLYLPAEYIARHDVAACRLAARFPGGMTGSGDNSRTIFPALELPGFSRRMTAINISAFRYLDVAVEASALPAHVRQFRSSGTSAQGRSTSSFSVAGIEAYKEAITAGFRQQLARHQFAGKSGLSLIPTPAAWPESSLAAMLDWIGESMPVEHLEAPAAGDSSSRFHDKFLTSFQRNRTPVWVFGTAFHFLPLLESGVMPRLHPGSLVFYTGGTKGRTRDIGDRALVDWLAAATGLPHERIVSEYGMSELASAAYTDPTRERCLKFQEGVIPFVVTAMRAGEGRESLPAVFEGAASGTGLLGVFDMHRVDIPAPIITEDVVRLSRDGSFELLGRADTAPLKGCSTLVESVGGGDSHARVEAGAKPVNVSTRPFLRGTVIHAFRSFSGSAEALTALASSTGSRRAAELALEDLRTSVGHVTSNPGSWDLCLERSAVLETGPRHLIIPPNSHPLAAVYPLAVALAAGKDVTLKMTRREAVPESFLRALLRHLAGIGLTVKTVPPGYRITSLDAWDNILAFGDNSTIAALKAATGKRTRLSGHGDALAVTIVPLREIPELMPGILRDTFGLMQKGCMSSRMLGIILPDNAEPSPDHASITDAVTRSLKDSWWQAWGEPLPHAARAGLLLRCMDWSMRSDVVMGIPGHGMPAVVCSSTGEPAPFGPMLSVCVIPGNITPDELLRRWKANWPQVKLVTMPAGMIPSSVPGDGIERRPLGRANLPSWDGLHFGEPLFRPS